MPRAARLRTAGVVRPGEIAHVVLCVAAAVSIVLVTGIGMSALAFESAPIAAVLPPVLSLLTLAALAALGLARFVRPVEIAVARTLLGVPLPDAIAEPTIATRMLGVAWFVVCGMIGFVVGVALTAVLPLAASLVLGPLTGVPDVMATGLPPFAVRGSIAVASGAGLGIVLIALVVLTVLAAGRGLTLLAPIFLGATDADRRVLDERRVLETARANTIARELHDSVGHALTAIAVQAGAARVRPVEAAADGTLETIAELARHALGELDAALGALRRDATSLSGPGAEERGRRSGTDSSVGDGPATATLATVLATAGRVLRLDASVDSLDGVPAEVEAACVRIVQESLTNAVRHGDGAAVLRIEREPGSIRIRVRNQLGEAERVEPAGAQRRHGRGVAGMRERVVLLGGTVSVGHTSDGAWSVDARIPLRVGRTAPEHLRSRP